MDTSYIKKNPITAIIMLAIFIISFFWVKPSLEKQWKNNPKKDMTEWTIHDWKRDIDNHINKLDRELSTCNTLACLSSTVPMFGNIGKYNSLLTYYANFTSEQEQQIKDYYSTLYKRITDKHVNRINN